MFVINTHIVPKIEEEIRLYDYAHQIFQKYIPSKKGIKKSLKRGEIWVDNKEGKSGDWVREGQKIELRDLELNPPKPYKLALEILFEDEHLVVINKPAGISVSGNQYRTIQNAIIGQFKKSRQLDALKWPRPVHRLDNQTSGILVIAKTAHSIIHLSKQFEERKVEKKYHAIVMGTPDATDISIRIDDVEAKTTLVNIKSVKSIKSGSLSLVELQPKTGRTHQLRIHCSKSGYPILGDSLYGEKGNTLLHKGLFLAATEITFSHPINNEKINIKIGTPSKFENRLKRELNMYNKLV